MSALITVRTSNNEVMEIIRKNSMGGHASFLILKEELNQLIDELIKYKIKENIA